MKIEREISPADLLALVEYLRRQPDVRRALAWERGTIAGLGALVAFFALMVLFAHSASSSPWWFASAPVIGLALFCPLWSFLVARANRRFVEGNRGSLGVHEFWVAEEAFGSSTPLGSTFHKWSRLHEVEDTPERVFVRVDRANNYVVPKQGKVEEASAFLALLRERSEDSGTSEGCARDRPAGSCDQRWSYARR
jgi:hypothetical protein